MLKKVTSAHISSHTIYGSQMYRTGSQDTLLPGRQNMLLVWNKLTVHS